MLLIHRYIIKQFLNTLIFSLIALCAIFVIVNLLENLDDFLDAKASLQVVVLYYVNFLPEIIKLLTPVGVLISALFTVGRLSNLNEITAMKSGGMSLYRIMFPYLLLCLMLSLGQLYFNGWIVPKANIAKTKLETKYLGETAGGPIFNFYYRDTPNRTVIMSYFDAEKKIANGVSIDEFSGTKSPRLVKRISGNTMRWDNKKNIWVLARVISREFVGDRVINTRLDSLEIKINVSGDQIVQLQKKPEQMTFDEMKEYIEVLRRGGKDVKKMEIEYYAAYAFPYANIIVILFAIPFSSVKKKNGLAIQIAAAMIVSFIYLIFTKLGQSVGYNANMSPILSGWLANIVFLIIGLGVLFRTKT